MSYELSSLWIKIGDFGTCLVEHQYGMTSMVNKIH